MGGRGLYLVPFVLSACLFVFFLFCFLLFFSRGKSNFNTLEDRVIDSSSAGQSMTYVSILEA